MARRVDGPSSPLETWWTTPNDPKLVELIHEARWNSLAAQTAAARVREARAQLGIATGRCSPDVVVDASYSRQEPSENRAQIQLPGITDPFDLYDLGVGFLRSITAHRPLLAGLQRIVRVAGAG